MDPTERLACELAVRFGTFSGPTSKPYSVTRRSNSAILKIYRGITPNARQQRELDALTEAPALGLHAPKIYDFGKLGDDAWMVTEAIPTAGFDLRTSADCAAYLKDAVAVLTSLHCHRRAGAGLGWRQRARRDRVTNSRFLLEQLSRQCRAMPWWDRLAGELATLDNEPTVLLHGDVKPDHVLRLAEHVYLVDWEASARGPAVCDHADLLFHVVRDAVFDRALRLPAAMSDQVLARPHLAPVVGWRFVLWADRRREEDLARLPRQCLQRVMDATSVANIVAALQAAIVTMRDLGTPR